MQHVRTRNDLIEWLENNDPYPRIKRALSEGQVENLGAFERIVPGSKPGWIIKVTSIHNKIWYIVIEVRSKGIIHIWEINTVPWEFWIGDQSKNKLYQGDNPKKYKELRDDTCKSN